MNSKVKLWAGIVGGGIVAALITFGAGGMGSGDGNAVRAGMNASGKGAPGPNKSTSNGGKSSQGVTQSTGGNGI